MLKEVRIYSHRRLLLTSPVFVLPLGLDHSSDKDKLGTALWLLPIHLGGAVEAF